MFLTRGLVAAAVVAMVVAACGTPAATPSASRSASPSGTPSPTPIATWQPPASLGPSATEAPSESPTPSVSASPSTKLAAFPMVMGSAPLAAPAADWGAVAGTEINDFGLNLFRQLATKSNVCLSPTSIALALAMVRPGAKGQTAAEMDKVLPGLGTAADASELAALMRSFAEATQYLDANGAPLGPDATPDPANPNPVTELEVSDQAFIQQGMAVEQAYLDAISSRFGAGVGLLDFKNDPEAARLVINKWASDQTKGRIPEVLKLGTVTKADRVALANAIYLKAAWLSKFDPKLTKQAAFTTAAGTKVSVPTMAIDQTFGYSAGAGYKAVELPYSGGMSMTVVVPDDMASFVSGLTAAKLSKLIVYGDQTYDVDLTLPRFSIDTSFELSGALEAMGMPTLFSSAADLSGVTTDEQLHVGSVIHEANIDVVESGTTAAAVTVVLMATGGGGPQEPPIKVQFHVNKPFLYFIRDNIDGALLFMGRVDDPSK